MGELEFVGRMNPQRLTSLAEDSKREQAGFRNDEANERLEEMPLNLYWRQLMKDFSIQRLGALYET